MEVADQKQCLVWKKYSSSMAFFKGDPGPFLENNYTSYMWVRKMELQLPDDDDKIGDSIGNLTELTNLSISHSRHLKCLPKTITRLQKLEELWVTGCEKFVLPENLDELVSLKHLTLEVGDIKSLPDVLFKLTKLETLCLRGILDVLTEFPENFNQLVNLRSFSLMDCELRSFPDSITNLPNLETLQFYHTHFLKPLLPPNLHLKKLKLTQCSIHSLPSGLCHLEIAHSFSEKEIVFDILNYLEQHLDQLADLKTLSMSCNSIKFLPSMPKLYNLQELILKECYSLHELPRNLDELAELCILNISCSRLKSLPCNITKLHNLRELILKNCYSICELPQNLQELVKLCTLNISGTKIKSLPCCISKLPNLLSLSLPKCFRLETLPNKLYESVFLFIDGMVMDLNDSISIDSCNEDNETVLDSVEEVDEVISEESGQGITAENTSPDKLNQTVAEIEETHYNGKQHSSIGEISHHEVLASGDEDCTSTLVDQIYASENLVKGGSTHHTTENEQGHKIMHNDHFKSKKQKIQITREDVEDLMSKNMRLVDAAKQLGVTRSTMKRRLRKLGISSWPSSRNNNRFCFNNRKHNSESSIIENEPSELTLKLPENDQTGNKPVPDCLSKFVVKATYKEDTVRFEIFSTANLDELELEVAMNLKLELNKFKIKYQDTDKEWVLMTLDSHLEYALNLSKSSESKIVRLLITPM